MTHKPEFSLGRRLVTRLAVGHALVLAANVPYFLWRDYARHRAEGYEMFSTNWLLHEIVTDIVPVMVPLLAVTVLIAIVTVRTSLAPIRKASHQAEGFDAAHLDVRLSEDNVPGELQPLIRAVNSGLDRLAEGLQSQRRFTADAAHELRTPLAVLRARCSDQGSACAQALTADIDRMGRVVDQLLGIARLEMGQVPFDGPVDLREVCEQTVAAMFPLAIESGLDLGFSCREAVVLPRGNATALEDALRNLVENAIHHAPSGTSIDVELGPGALIRVLDCGPGVPDCSKTEIFQPFRRLPGARKPGTGLGLAIAADAVQMHGGRIWVRDRTGGGAEFIIDLSSGLGPSDCGNVAGA